MKNRKLLSMLCTFLTVAFITTVGCKNNDNDDNDGILLFTLSPPGLTPCDPSPSDPLPDNSGKVSISQGVWGDVLFLSGNFIPTTDCASGGTTTPVQRTIHVHEPTTSSDTTFDADTGLLTSIATNKVAEIQSDEEGFFEVSLSPGKYSFFPEENVDGAVYYFGNGFDEDGHILPATVSVDETTYRKININYEAAY